MLEPIFGFAATLSKSAYQPEETAIIFTGAIGGSSIIIYNLFSSGFLLASGIGDDPLEVQLSADLFVPGNYTIVNTKEPNGCQTFTLDKCRSNPDYIGETVFSINANQQPAQSPAEESSFLGAVGELFGF